MTGGSGGSSPRPRQPFRGGSAPFNTRNRVRRGHVVDHAFGHVPVMAGRVTALLVPALATPAAGGRPPVFVDATLGRAGHARALLAACPGLILIGIDADETAIA